MLSGFIFFTEVHISLVNLILLAVIRYQDHSLRKNLSPTHPRGFSRGNKINDKHWYIMNNNHNRYGNAKEWQLLSLCSPVTPALCRVTRKCTSRSLVHSRVTLLHTLSMARTAPTRSRWGHYNAPAESCFCIILHFPQALSATLSGCSEDPHTWSLWHKAGIKQTKALSSGIS